MTMILKESDPSTPEDQLAAAGQRAERQMGHYLRRAFADRGDIRVFNDLRLERNGEIAQMDHLIIHTWGMIIVESKSVTSRVRINDREEWSRWWNGKELGMPSPVLQGQRQGYLLRKFLDDNAEEVATKILGLLQIRFGAMPIDVLVAISDQGIIGQPKRKPLSEVCKADQVPDRIIAIISKWKQDGNLLNFRSNGGYTISRTDVEKISEFLLKNHRPRESQLQSNSMTEPSEPQPSKPQNSTPAATTPPQMQSSVALATNEPSLCRHCRSDRLSVLYGRFGYYFKCSACEGNTPIKMVCEGCGAAKRTRKQRLEFFSECERCGTSELFFANT